jgi:peptide/nickel transport system permease protein
MSTRRWLRRVSASLLVLIFSAALLANAVAPAGYEEQFRDSPNVGPCRRFPLGTDELGRDRLSRLLHGSRISLLLAPGAALLAVSVGLLLGAAAGYCEGLVARAALSLTDLAASLPSLLLLLFARAMLPLNVDPKASITITFVLLGAVGWTSSVRMFAAAIVSARQSDYVKQARAAGCRPGRIVGLQIASAIRPVLAAQFWILVPLFLLAEANLSMLGLGVNEPLPSWGNLLTEIPMTPGIWQQPWLLAPTVLMLVVLLSLQGFLLKENAS